MIPVGPRIIYEDNHIIVINKLPGELTQPDPQGSASLEQHVKEFIRVRDSKPGNVFLGVVHRLDRPVSGAVVMAKTSKALVRLNEAMRNREIKKTYWAITAGVPLPEAGTLTGYLLRDGKKNITRVYEKQVRNSQQAILNYELLSRSDRYSLLEVDLVTGRHHQIRAQLADMGWPVRGDLKYGAPRSLPGGGISLHSRSVSFSHPVTGLEVVITAPVPDGDALWLFFEEAITAAR